ncbi:MAG: hypothetical protein DRI24_22070 [Deltaproteobacteria bacterium]|nr:MAG: hypothetical protein DRI24_22070 [Deltaproteobacteria bacterium]
METKKAFLALLLLLFILSFTYSQQSQATSGGDASGSGGSVSYSVGQIVYTTNTGDNGSVAQGVQQPYEIQIIMAIDGNDGIFLEYSVYPNPTTDLLNLKIDHYRLEGLRYLLYDMQGHLLDSKKITGKITTLNMGGYVPSAYLLQITDHKKEIKVFKIIKK